jgi:hypothetical protein
MVKLLAVAALLAVGVLAGPRPAECLAHCGGFTCVDSSSCLDGCACVGPLGKGRCLEVQ